MPSTPKGQGHVVITRVAVGLGVILIAGGSWIWNAVSASDQRASETQRIGESLRGSLKALATTLAGPSSSDSASTANRVRRMQQLFDTVRALTPSVPKDSFDVATIVAETGRDPVALHKWVHERTTLIPYRGVLRGAVGTLMDRAGNSLDRSLLLSELLRTTGATTRLARARLSDEQVASLQQRSVSATPSPRQNAPTDLTPAENSALQAYSKLAGIDTSQFRQQLGQFGSLAQQTRNDLRKRVSAQSALLVKSLELTAGDATDPSSVDRDALADHWWVQVQRGEEWIDFDPALDRPRAAVTAAEDTIDARAIPADLQHSIDVRIVIEKWDGSDFVEAQPVTLVVVPSEMLGETIRLQHIPMAWPKDDARSEPDITLNATALGQHEWLPVLSVGARRVSQSSILENGNVNSQPGAKPIAAVASAINDVLGGGSDQTDGTLTAEWIEYEIHAPGSESRIIRRELFDLVGAANRAGHRGPASLSDQQRLTRALSLLGETESLPLPCQLSPAFVAHLMGMRLLQNEAAMTTLLRAGPDVSPQQIREQTAKAAALPGVLHSFAVARADWSAALTGTSIRQLNVASRHIIPHQNSDGGVVITDAFDIVSNEVLLNRGTPAERFEASIEQGVLDSNAEAVLAGSTAGNSAASLLLDSGPAASRWVAVRAVEDLDQLAPSADLRARLEADLRSGFFALAPARAGTGDVPAVWWRVNPRTGDTLAFGDRGWGQANAEYAVLGGLAAAFGTCMLLETETGAMKYLHFRMPKTWPACFFAGGVGAGGQVFVFFSFGIGFLMMVVFAALFIWAWGELSGY